MNTNLISFIGLALALAACAPKDNKAAESTPAVKKLFLDVHDMGPGKVTAAAVADAHKKDLATQGEFDVPFHKYWVDEQAGKVYCLAEATSQANLFKTHQKAHGLVPDYIMEVTDGPGPKLRGKPP